MMEWTPAAKDELNRHLENIRPGLEGSGADPAEVLDDIRRHVEEEALRERLSVVTEVDVRRITSRMGPVSTGVEPPPTPLPTHWKSFVYFGSILAVVTVVIEIMTRMCAGSFMDPLPTPWHAALALSVPLGAMVTWRLALRTAPPPSWSALGTGFSWGIALYYSIVFLPLMPLGAVAIVGFGMGLLPLAPFFSLLAVIFAYKALALRFPAKRLAGLTAGIALSWGALFVIELPDKATVVGMDWAASPEAGKAQKGLSFLRRFGSAEHMLRACYMRRSGMPDLLLLTFGSGPVPTDKARNIYFKVFGVPFNSLPAPDLRGRSGMRDLATGFVFDPEQGGEVVGGRVKDLALASSRLDGSVDGLAALGYFAWTMTLQNASSNQQEARAVLALPPGGAVSRVTLWVNGEEREAAFSQRGKAQQAYQQVVQRRRDPVLVTTRGPDRVMVQLFPVPPNGGTMKVRLGITAPAAALTADEWVFQLPSICERNFGLGDLKHSIWIESKQGIRSLAAGLAAEPAAGKAHALRGEVRESDLAAGLVVSLESPPAKAVTGPDAFGGSVHQTVDSTAARTPVVLVVDGSKSMESHVPAIARAASGDPAALAAVLAAAGDDVAQWSGAEAAGRLAGLKTVGGQDNVPALIRGWDAAAAAGGAVVWVHGPLPVVLSPVEGLTQRWERRPDGPVVYEVPAIGGANAVAGALDASNRLVRVPRKGTLEQDLAGLLDRLSGARPSAVVKRSRGGGSGPRTSEHLARLWALDEVRRLLASGSAKDRSAAQDLAVRYRLVTPLTGAVVLETDEQYKQAGLEVPDPSKGPSVPIIPEPGTSVLIGLSLLVFLWWTRRRRSCAA
ncbi:MAG: PEP-CTERM sorting domain-containing protein [Elusimicrobia bacterium]|nr:PEP-CTERM sorting domain-containing protein [Elusimicrobiota bacterium]